MKSREVWPKPLWFWHIGQWRGEREILRELANVAAVSILQIILVATPILKNKIKSSGSVHLRFRRLSWRVRAFWVVRITMIFNGVTNQRFQELQLFANQQLVAAMKNQESVVQEKYYGICPPFLYCLECHRGGIDNE